MKIEARGNNIVLKEVYSGVLLETSEGNAIGICMRDDSFEINILPKGCKEYNWWTVDMQDGTIKKPEKGKPVPTMNGEIPQSDGKHQL